MSLLKISLNFSLSRSPRCCVTSRISRISYGFLSFLVFWLVLFVFERSCLIAFNILLLQVFLSPNKKRFMASMKFKRTPNLLLLALVFYSRWQPFILSLVPIRISSCDNPVLAFGPGRGASRWLASPGAAVSLGSPFPKGFPLPSEWFPDLLDHSGHVSVGQGWLHKQGRKECAKYITKELPCLLPPKPKSLCYKETSKSDFLNNSPLENILWRATEAAGQELSAPAPGSLSPIHTWSVQHCWLSVSLLIVPSDEVALHLCLFLACLICSSLMYLLQREQPLLGAWLDAV